MGKNRDFSKFPNAITVLDNGNVGINTSNFSTVISSKELKIGSDTNGAFVLGNTTTSIYGFVYGSTNAIDIGSGNAITLQTWNGTTYAERARITNSGSFGVGTSGPTRGIHISRNSDQAAILITKANDTANVAYLGTGSSSTGAGTENAILQMWHNGTENIRLYTQGNSWVTGGNLGVGGNSPSFKIDVSEAGSVINGTATIGSNMKGIRIYNSTTATNNNAIGLWFSTGPHQAGIASFRATADTTWETSLAFYTHVNTTSNLNDATEKMRISGEGYVTIPYQPSFLAASSGGQQDYTSGQVMVFNITRHNIGSCYNTSTGRFTAPVAGRYLFSVAFYTYGSYRASITLTINGAQYTPSDCTPLLYHETSVDSVTISSSIIFELSAGDYVEVRSRSGYNTRVYMSHSHFSGQLLG